MLLIKNIKPHIAPTIPQFNISEKLTFAANVMFNSAFTVNITKANNIFLFINNTYYIFNMLTC